MKATFKAGFIVVALTLSQSAIAGTGSWTRTAALQPIFGEGVEYYGSQHSGYQTTPAGALITTVSWSAGSYTNGWTAQQRKLCYTPSGYDTYTTCLDITNTPTGSTNVFAGLSAFKYAVGKFSILYTLTGGTYPTYPTYTNSVTVNYTY